VLAHDLGVLLGPLFLELFHLRLADHGIEAGAEMARDAAHLSDPLAHRAQRHGHVLGADDEHGHDHDD
jgi:hypothetical protein